MTEQVVLIAMGAVVAAIVLRPLLRRKRSGPASSKGVVPPASMSDEMAELELDREMGRVSDEDYHRWRAELERAAPVPVDASGSVSVRAVGVASAEDLVRRWREAPRPTCEQCGVRPEPQARFCSNCGSALSA